jgi:hypothetical protein
MAIFEIHFNYPVAVSALFATTYRFGTVLASYIPNTERFRLPGV